MTVITGAAYPAVVTAIAQVAFPTQANGSFITVNGQAVGSSLIGQAFDQPKYFWGRPSDAGVTASNPAGYDGTASAGSNLGPTSAGPHRERHRRRSTACRRPTATVPIPVDLVTASASGLDPDISPAAADYQVARVAAARGMTPGRRAGGRRPAHDQPLLGFIGEPAVNVLELNLDLDGLLNTTQ